jgi:hypothetical protein
MTRLEAPFTTIVEATTRSIPSSVNPLSINAREPSVA